MTGSSFNPNTPCTRAMTMEYLWKAAGSPNESTYAPYTLTCKEWGSFDNIYFDAAMVKKDTVTLCNDYGDWDTEQVLHGEKTTKQVTMIMLRPGSTMTINHTLYGNDNEFKNTCLAEYYQMDNNGIYHFLDVFSTDISDSFSFSGKRETIGYAELISLDGTDYFITVSQNSSQTSSAFTDVPANADYAQAVAWAVENGITSGTGNGQFSPDTTCTRGQIMTFLYRAMGK